MRPSRHAWIPAFAALLIASWASAQDSLQVPPPPESSGQPGMLGIPGTWHELARPVLNHEPRHGQSSIYDSDNGRIVEFGGFTAGGPAYQDDLLEYRLCRVLGWTPIVAFGVAPSARFGHSAIHDPIRKRMILFGGHDGSPSGQLFALSLTGVPTWSMLSPAGATPSPRYGHNAIYDPIRDRMIVFGGFDGTAFLNQVWALTLSGTPTWTQLSPANAPPAPRDYSSAIYDPMRDRMLIFGGNDGTLFNDVWGLALSGGTAWSPVPTAGTPPSARLAHAAVYDPVADRMLMIGGTAGLGTYMNDVWELPLAGASWSQLTPSGETIPVGHSRGATYAPDTREIVLHGGFTLASSSETRVISLPALTVSRPVFGLNGRHGHTAVVDPVRRRILLHGGEGFGLFSDLLEMPLDGPGYWDRPCVGAVRPSGRHGHAAVYDPVRDVIWMHGGFNGGYLGDLWTLSLAPQLSWGPASTVGTPPSPRDYASLIYDSSRDRLVLCGGNLNGFFLNDVWELSLGGTPTWSPLTPAGTPPTPRLAHRAVFDPARDRMIVVGGFDGAEDGEVWALEFSPTLAWVQLSPGGTAPTPRHSASLIRDPVRDRLVLFGGYDGTSRNDLWELPLSGPLVWAPLTPPAPLPPERHGQSAVYDPVNDLVVVSAGSRSQSTLLSDSWVLNWGSSATPTLVTLSSCDVRPDLVHLIWHGAESAWQVGAVMRRGADGAWQRIGTAIADGSGRWVYDDLEIQAGARYSYGLDLGDGPRAEVEVEVPLRPGFWFGGLVPSPASTESRLLFSLPAASRVRIEAFDVMGRRVAREDFGRVPAGVHRVAWAGRWRLGPGVYALKLITENGELSVRATIVR